MKNATEKLTKTQSEMLSCIDHQLKSNSSAEIVLDYRQKGGPRLSTLESLKQKGLIDMNRLRGSHLGDLVVYSITRR